MNKKLYPLKFNPVIQDKIWGRERWLISSMGEGLEGSVSNGFLAENTLSELLETYMGELVGDKVFEFYNLQLPVLVKKLEVDNRISVQVHPDDETAMERYGDYGKDEYWCILKADASARLFLGFKEDSSAKEFYERCLDGSVIEMLNTVVPKSGEIYRIKAGTVHSCCGALTIAEIQDPSDISLRLYDWGREKDPSSARNMHLEEALDIIDYSKFDLLSNRIRKIENGVPVVQDGHFNINSLVLEGTRTLESEDNGNFSIFLCTSGNAVLDGGGTSLRIAEGEAVFVPASLDSIVLSSEGGAGLLQIFAEKPEEKDRYINQ